MATRKKSAGAKKKESRISVKLKSGKAGKKNPSRGTRSARLGAVAQIENLQKKILELQQDLNRERARKVPFSEGATAASSVLSIPRFHEDQLLVRARLSSPPPPGAFALMGAAAATGGAPAAPTGSSALDELGRAGLLRRIVPLRQRMMMPHFAMGAAAGAATGAAPGAGPSKLDDVSLIEVSKGANLDQIQSTLAGDPSLAQVSRVPVRFLMVPAAAAAAPPTPSAMWNLLKTEWPEAVTSGMNPAENVHVAVLDSGIDQSHPDLPGSAIEYIHQFPQAGAFATETDIIGHGTHVAGTIRAVSSNAFGINGICSCRLSAWKIFDDEPTYDPRTNSFVYYVNPILYRAALEGCLDRDVDVINLSIGGYGEPDFLEQELFGELVESGVAVVAAMGNHNTPTPSYPAAIPGVIGVGATSLNDSKASFSNYGSHIALSAPGVGIWSTLPTYPGQSGFSAIGTGSNVVPGVPNTRETMYAAWNGTSMASPHVAAAAAVLLATVGTGNISAAEIKARLQASTDSVEGMNGLPFTPFFGTGRLNFLKLLQIGVA